MGDNLGPNGLSQAELSKMKRAGRLSVASVAFAAIIATAQAADVDWKMYSGASVSGPEICFYDANGAVRTPERLVRVSTKCFSRKDLDNVDVDKDFAGKISKSAARKMQEGYMPPIGLVENIDGDRAFVVAMYEEIANISGIQPETTGSYEFNCPQKIMRDLSIDLRDNVQRGSKNIPSNWRYVPQAGNEASLLKILCR
jgi:hypothetical protein